MNEDYPSDSMTKKESTLRIIAILIFWFVIPFIGVILFTEESISMALTVGSGVLGLAIFMNIILPLSFCWFIGRNEKSKP